MNCHQRGGSQFQLPNTGCTTAASARREPPPIARIVPPIPPLSTAITISRVKPSAKCCAKFTGPRTKPDPAHRIFGRQVGRILTARGPGADERRQIAYDPPTADGRLDEFADASYPE